MYFKTFLKVIRRWGFGDPGALPALSDAFEVVVENALRVCKFSIVNRGTCRVVNWAERGRVWRGCNRGRSVRKRLGVVVAVRLAANASMADVVAQGALGYADAVEDVLGGWGEGENEGTDRVYLYF